MAMYVTIMASHVENEMCRDERPEEARDVVETRSSVTAELEPWPQ